MLNAHRALRRDITKLRIILTATMCDDIPHLKRIFEECVKSVQPEKLIRTQVGLRERHLCVNGQTFELKRPCHVVGFGKAVMGMALKIETILGPDLQRAVVTIPQGLISRAAEKSRVEFIEGARNNLPDDAAMRGALEIKNLAEGLTEDDLLIVLISGGGSALLPLPKPPVTLQEKLTLVRDLSRSGADIAELNTVRKQLSLLKGGGLAKIAYPAKVVSLVLSDVVGDPLDVIASGPTVPNRTTADNAVRILEKYSLYATTSDRVKSALLNQFGEEPVTRFPHVTNFVIGNNAIASAAAVKAAACSGFQAVVVSNRVEGTVDDVAKLYATLARKVMEAATADAAKTDLEGFLTRLPWKTEEGAVERVLRWDFSRKMLFVFAGETTVVVTGGGTGGRNQQLALAFSIALNNAETADVSFLSGGTDGIDGPTEAAGAAAYGGMVADCSRQDINPRDYLENNDSHGFYSAFDGGRFLVKVGHTGTNVMDMHLLAVSPGH
ncbi:glycerate kinase [Cylas formicarius]|uniref:glycerate kinase n=1 Tax=Cylas formicarius TaxID=197179 RepID=UPI0029588B70|nr:glycerate kinase [Cylas formicarius]